MLFFGQLRENLQFFLIYKETGGLWSG